MLVEHADGNEVNGTGSNDEVVVGWEGRRLAIHEALDGSTGHILDEVGSSIFRPNQRQIVKGQGDVRVRLHLQHTPRCHKWIANNIAAIDGEKELAMFGEFTETAVKQVT